MLIRQKTNDNNRAKLYLVATPIGNFSDITYRAIEVLSMVEYIYCEDTRITKKLLLHYNIDKKLKSYHNHNENILTEEIINHVEEGRSVAIVSDAGMPLISDPGFLAVKEATNRNIDIVVIPGVSASLTALVGSGIACNRFLFVGFLNSKDGKRKQELEKLRFFEETIILYESPHRITETLEMLNELMPNRYIVLARELTKKYEEYLRGTAAELLEVAGELKGEIVIVISGAKANEINKELLDLSITEHYQHYLKIGYDSKEAMKKVAKDRNVSKSLIYQDIMRKD